MAYGWLSRTLCLEHIDRFVPVTDLTEAVKEDKQVSADLRGRISGVALYEVVDSSWHESVGQLLAVVG